MSITNVVLKRVYLSNCTLGKMSFGSHNVYTLEEPDINNHRNISCIPEGKYNVVKGTNSKGKNVFKVQNVPNRSYIQIHIGNTLSDICGCIAVGKTQQYANNTPKVLSSTVAFNEMWEALPNSFTLTIKKKETFGLQFQ